MPLELCFGELTGKRPLDLLTDFVFLGDVWLSLRTSMHSTNASHTHADHGFVLRLITFQADFY